MSHMTRHSNLTEYRYASYPFNGQMVNATDVSFKWEGERYGCRFPGFLNTARLAEEEDRFIERQHTRRPGPRGIA